MFEKVARCVQVGLALGLMAAAPWALGQKMYRCSDGKGGTTFQQSPCPETAQEAEARAKEKERLEAEAARRKAEEAKKKEEALAKARERDKAYQQQLQERAEAKRKAEEAERKILEGTGKEPGAAPVAGAASGADDDGNLPAHVAQTYPGPWKTGGNAIISSALAKKQVAGCAKYRYRQRPKGEFMVNCTPGKDHYFVWPQSEAVSGPVKF
jgi:hypothetical protein